MGILLLLKGMVIVSLNRQTSFRISNAEIVQVENPQIDFGLITTGADEIRITPDKPGKYTLFAELKNGNVSLYEPIELIVKEPWSIVEDYQAWNGGEKIKPRPARLLSPDIDRVKQVLQFKLANNTQVKQTGNMVVEICGQQITKSITLTSE